MARSRGHRRRRCPACHRRRYVAVNGVPPRKRWGDVGGQWVCYVCVDKSRVVVRAILEIEHAKAP